jgi:DNA-directed RNA polymerase specialized sigma24 family protein
MTGRPRRSSYSTAADCDWSFLQNEELMGRLETEVWRVARRLSLSTVAADDIKQEVLLYLGVRPEITQEKNATNIARRVRRFLMTQIEVETRKQQSQIPWDYVVDYNLLLEHNAAKEG